MKTRIKKNELADWIKDLGQDSLMMTIGKPHAKAVAMGLELQDLEPIVSSIIELTNHYVFGKHKHFEYLNGIVTVEGGLINPHFHIVFQKPEGMDFERFKSKLEKVAKLFCNEDFTFQFDFDAKDKFFIRKRVLQAISQPCYPDYVRVTNAHENIGGYLTKEIDARYFILSGRKPRLNGNGIDLFVDFFNGLKPFQRINSRQDGGHYAHV